MGFVAAATVRVGNALGAGKPEQVKLSAKVSLACGCHSSWLCVFILSMCCLC